MTPSRDPEPYVLVCDDSPLVRLALTRRLRAEGLRVVERGSATEARGALSGEAPACALLDVDLGDGDGTDLAYDLRAHHPALPIAFFTATLAPDALERATRVGTVFHKPEGLDAAIAWAAARVRG